MGGHVQGNKNRGWKPSGQFGHKLAESVDAAQRRSDHEHSTFHFFSLTQNSG